jgi:serine-type D-Ala-D-Ala endopeptidase (penicillin-binding protein 7)
MPFAVRPMIRCAVAGLFCLAAMSPVAAARKPAPPKYPAAASQLRQARAAEAAARAQAPAQPRTKVDAQGDVVPDVRAEAAIIYNPATNKVLWEERAFDQRSIASITKVMTALCFLEDAPDLARQAMVTAADIRGASVTHLRASEKVTLQNLLYLMLVASDNAAARVLARMSPYGGAGFIVRMNQKASELGLASTSYADPSGLLPQNVSSAYDMARLIAYAADDAMIASVMRTEAYSFRTDKRAVTIHSTNQLLRSTGVDVRGGKTGFIAQAGYCLATLLHLPDIDQTVAVVVLGARSNAGRFSETKNLLNWIASKAQSFMGGQQE